MDIFEQIAETQTGNNIHTWVITNRNFVGLQLSNYGASIIRLFMPDKQNNVQDIVLGFDNAAQYLQPHPYFGCTVGRYANRIANGRFTIQNKEYHIDTNNDGNHLHGGNEGFGRKFWNHEVVRESDALGIRFSYVSQAGEAGYPGTVQVTNTITLNKNNEVLIRLEATTDAATHINLTHHSYFNLSGQHTNHLQYHQLTTDAQHYVQINNNLLPTGTLLPISDIGMQYLQAADLYSLLHQQGGYDYCFVRANNNSEQPAATLLQSANGRRLRVYTNQPAFQLYTSNTMHRLFTGKRGVVYDNFSAVCIEPQHFPDSPNQPHFPSTLLLPEQKYVSLIKYELDVVS